MLEILNKTKQLLRLDLMDWMIDKFALTMWGVTACGSSRPMYHLELGFVHAMKTWRWISHVTAGGNKSYLSTQSITTITGNNENTVDISLILLLELLMIMPSVYGHGQRRTITHGIANVITTVTTVLLQHCMLQVTGPVIHCWCSRPTCCSTKV